MLWIWLTLQSLVVSIFIVGFNVKNSAFFPHKSFYALCMIFHHKERPFPYVACTDCSSRSTLCYFKARVESSCRIWCWFILSFNGWINDNWLYVHHAGI